MISKPILLLDTTIVAGLFANTKHTVSVADRNTWEAAVSHLAAVVSTDCLIRVPTPVCYELMCMNHEWKEFVTQSPDPIFRFAKYSITADTLQRAAEYHLAAVPANTLGKPEKKKTMDSLIAAYALQGGHYLLTANEKDFPPTHFEVIETKTLTLSATNRIKHRKTICLLKPIKE